MAAAAFSGIMPAAHAQNGRRIVLRGTARLEVRAARKGGWLAVAGRATDDAGEALDSRVTISALQDAASSGAGALVPLTAASVQNCDHGEAGTRGASLIDDTGGVVVSTNAAGRFCARLLLPVDRYILRARVPATDLVDGAEASLAIDLGRAPISLRFDPPGPVLWIDGGPLTIEAVAMGEDDDSRTPTIGLQIELANEAGTSLGTAVTDETGHARFVVPGAKLGPPGQGELRLTFAGNAAIGPAARAEPVQRSSHVDLAMAGPEGAPLGAGSPEDGIDLHLRAVLRCAKDGCAGSPTGAVEARLVDGAQQLVGAVAIDRGEATLVATFPMPASTSAKLRLRYAPDAPWFLPGSELEIDQALEAGNPWRAAWMAAAASVVTGLVVLARMPLRKRKDGGAGPEPERGPGVTVVRTARGFEGWTGTAVDVHDRYALAGVRVAIERRGMLGVETLGQAFTDARGWFSLPSLVARPGDELVAEGPFHATLRRPLPGSGELAVALVQRKRAILNDLVEWVRKQEGRFRFKAEPTPGELREVTASHQRDVAAWAQAVEQAAYSGSPVDAIAHETVSRLVPAESRALPAPVPTGVRDGKDGQAFRRGAKKLVGRP